MNFSIDFKDAEQAYAASLLGRPSYLKILGALIQATQKMQGCGVIKVY